MKVDFNTTMERDKHEINKANMLACETPTKDPQNPCQLGHMLAHELLPYTRCGSKTGCYTFQKSRTLTGSHVNENVRVQSCVKLCCCCTAELVLRVGCGEVSLGFMLLLPLSPAGGKHLFEKKVAMLLVLLGRAELFSAK